MRNRKETCKCKSNATTVFLAHNDVSKLGTLSVSQEECSLEARGQGSPTPCNHDSLHNHHGSVLSPIRNTVSFSIFEEFVGWLT